MNTNNDVKLRRFIVPKKVKQINDHLFLIYGHQVDCSKYRTFNYYLLCLVRACAKSEQSIDATKPQVILLHIIWSCLMCKESSCIDKI